MRSALATVMAVAITMGAPYARGVEPPTLDLPPCDKLLGELGFDEKDRRDVLAGEIVTVSPGETSRRELAIRAAVVVDASLDDVAAVLDGVTLTALQTDVFAVTPIADGVDPSLLALRRVVADPEELERLLEVEPGSSVNLGRDEIVRLQSVARDHGTVSSDETRAAVAAAVGLGLSTRLSDYRRAGLAGIGAYARGDDELVRPGDDLRSATAALGWLGRAAPSLHRTLRQFPHDGSAGDDHRFCLVGRMVQDRPTLVLVHHVGLASREAIVLVERQVYASHSYDAAQTVVVARAHGPRTLLLIEARSATGQVTGLRQVVAKRIGRGRLSDSVVAHLEAIRREIRRRR